MCTLEFDGSAMQCPLLSETGRVWYSEPRVHLLYLLSAVRSSDTGGKINAEWFFSFLFALHNRNQSSVDVLVFLMKGS